MHLSDDRDLSPLLDLCGIQTEDRQNLLAARPDPVRDPEWWDLIERHAAELDADWDRPTPSTGFAAWPRVPEAAPPVGLFAGAWALLAAAPRLIELHRSRGIPAAVTRETADGLGGVMAGHREQLGRPGVGLFPLWEPPLRFRGAGYQLGRHSYTRTELSLGGGVDGYGLMMHVPPSGPLDPATSEESVALARESFARWYPEEPIAAFVCKSWLLDPQLGEYLRPESNIMRFQRRFDVLPLVEPDDPFEGDHELMRLGLHLRPPEGPLGQDDLRRIPRQTSLQRAYVEHLRAGRHWHIRTGLLRF